MPCSGIGRAIDIKLGGGEGLQQMRFGSRRILRDEKNLGTAQSDGAIEPEFTESIGLDDAGEAQCAGRGEAGVNANLIVAHFEFYVIRTEHFAFGADLDGARYGGWRDDAQIHGKLLASERDGGNGNGFQAQSGLGPASESECINRNAEALRLPSRARDAARVLLAVRDQDDARNHVGRKRADSFFDAGFQIGSASGFARGRFQMQAALFAGR